MAQPRPKSRRRFEDALADNLVIIALVIVGFMLALLYLNAAASNYQSCMLEAQAKNYYIDGCNRWNPLSRPTEP